MIKEFIVKLGQQDRKKLLYALERTVENGLPKNEQKFRKISGENLWEFKSDQVRVLCFFEKDKIILLTHGFIKKSDKTPRKELEKAKNIMNAYTVRKVSK